MTETIPPPVESAPWLDRPPVVFDVRQVDSLLADGRRNSLVSLRSSSAT